MLADQRPVTYETGASWCASLRRSGDGADFRRAFDAGADADIGRAPAQVSVHRVVDVRIGGARVALEQRGGGHDLSRLAVSALRNIELSPRLLERMLRAG